jgi:hypothetical protein
MDLFDILDSDLGAEPGVKVTIIKKIKNINQRRFHIFLAAFSATKSKSGSELFQKGWIRTCSNLTHLAKSISTRLSGQELQW